MIVYTIRYDERSYINLFEFETNYFKTDERTDH